MSNEDALEVGWKDSGTHVEPDVVRAFDTLIRKRAPESLTPSGQPQ